MRGNTKRAKRKPTKLVRVERAVWDARQKAFKRYYGDGRREGYADGLGWGILATFDNVLSMFREVIDGAGGSGWQQMEKQAKRIGRKRLPRERRR